MGVVESKCKSCKAPIYWVVTESGKQLPLDVTPVTNGNIIMRSGRAHTITMFDRVSDHEARFISHFATCPQAKQWRQKGSGNGQRPRQS